MKYLLYNSFILYFDLGTCSGFFLSDFAIIPFLVAIMVAILNCVWMLPQNQLNIVKTGFIDPKNAYLDTKIMALAVLEPFGMSFLCMSAFLADPLVAILNFVLILLLNQLNIINTDFLDAHKPII